MANLSQHEVVDPRLCVLCALQVQGFSEAALSKLEHFSATVFSPLLNALGGEELRLQKGRGEMKKDTSLVPLVIL